MPKSRVSKDITAVRGPVHGNFEEGSRITQGIMSLLQSGSQWNSLTDGQKEALHMIVHKSHRIVTGNSQHKDHWDDIGGYAQLGADACHDAPAPVRLPKRVKAVRVRVKATKPAKVAKKKVTARPRPAAKKAKAKKRAPVRAPVERPLVPARRPRTARTPPAPVAATTEAA